MAILRYKLTIKGPNECTHNLRDFYILIPINVLARTYAISFTWTTGGIEKKDEIIRTTVLDFYVMEHRAICTISSACPDSDVIANVRRKVGIYKTKSHLYQNLYKIIIIGMCIMLSMSHNSIYYYLIISLWQTILDIKTKNVT